MSELGFWSVLPPLVALSLAIYTRQVFVSIFGDHCSPISDSTIISSMAAATDHSTTSGPSFPTPSASPASRWSST